MLTSDPGTGRDASRRRRLRARARGGRRARRADPHARTVTDRHIVAMGGGQDVGRSGVPFRGRPAGSTAAEGLSAAHRRERGAVSVMRFLSVFPADRFELTFLDLFARDDRDVRAYLLAQDLIFVGGGTRRTCSRSGGCTGSTRSCRRRGRRASSSPAGAPVRTVGSRRAPRIRSVRWLRCTTVSGLLPGSFCPHYAAEPGRRPLYQALVADGLPGRGSRATTWRPCTTSGPSRRGRGVGSFGGRVPGLPRGRRVRGRGDASRPDSSAAERSRCIPWCRGVALPPCRSEWGER